MTGGGPPPVYGGGMLPFLAKLTISITTLLTIHYFFIPDCKVTHKLYTSDTQAKIELVVWVSGLSRFTKTKTFMTGVSVYYTNANKCLFFHHTYIFVT